MFYTSLIRAFVLLCGMSFIFISSIVYPDDSTGIRLLIYYCGGTTLTILFDDLIKTIMEGEGTSLLENCKK